jgi:tRNA A-37 threonylcarbamoyl transferase component Bud32
MSDVYWFNPDYQQVTALVDQLGSLDRAFACQIKGTYLTGSPYSGLYRVESPIGYLYVKIYRSAGKHLRRFIGRSRPQAEWENLKLFENWGINVPDRIAYGERRVWGLFRMAVIVTREVPFAVDLMRLSQEQPSLFKEKNWLVSVMNQVAELTRQLHHQGFIHNDLKWRNILIESNTQLAKVYFIDCPVGRRRYGYMRYRGIIKDLACLDKVARQVLSRTDRLRFYLYYVKQKTLSAGDKRILKKIVHFFEGRA